MLCGDYRKFLNDELGGGTIFGPLWFVLLVGITGLAVDATDGLRNRTMLQATADAAALGGAIDLMTASAPGAEFGGNAEQDGRDLTEQEEQDRISRGWQ